MSRIFNKAGWIVAGVLALLVVASVTGIVLGGPLNPPGPPSVPTGKTQINSVPYTISAPGSYVLNSNLTCTSCGGAAITIAASNVTLDLQGFSLSGVSTLFGIADSGSWQNVAVRNGTLSGFSLVSVRMNQSVSVIEDLRVSGGTGITCAGGVVRNNLVSGTIGTGIGPGVNCTVTGNTVVNSGSYGIQITGAGNAVLNNTLSGNGAAAILVQGNDNRIDGNVIDANGAASAIRVEGSLNVITRNSGGNATGTPFDYVGANNTYGPTESQSTPLANPWANIAW